MEVKRYDIYMDVDFKGLSYAGRVKAEMVADRLELNVVDLSVRSVKVDGKQVKFTYDGKLIRADVPVTDEVEVEFAAKVPDVLMGFYRASQGEYQMLSTQFEAIGARRMFPCVDHPGYKASFRLSVKVDSDLDVISNMPPEKVEEQGEKKVVHFAETPRMSTYLLYLGIGKFDYVQDKLGQLPIAVVTPPGQGTRGKYALEVAKGAVSFYENYFGIPYQLPKLHLITVPEFAAGAMENWGAITFRETALLVDDGSSEETRRRVAEVIAHELAHQWFGDLVTMKWWEDLWLNESFATFMAYKAVSSMHPEWNMWWEFVLSETAGAMRRDSLKETHPIHVPIAKEEEIEQIFDDISYGKGASVLRMIEAFMGEEDFRKGVSLYLKRYSYGNATAEMLWEALQEASGKPIVKVMGTWVSKAGHPVVKADLQGSRVKLAQRKFRFLDPEEDQWPIPLTYVADGMEGSILVEGKEHVLELGKEVGKFKLNRGQTGFYRSDYSDWDKALQASKDALDRWGVASDAFARLMSGNWTLREYLGFVSKFKEETEYLPAWEVSSQFSLLHSVLGESVKEVMVEFHRRQLQLWEGRGDSNARLYRGILARRLAVVDDSYGTKVAALAESYWSVEPEMRQAVLNGLALHSTRPFGRLLQLYREAKTDEERTRILTAMLTTDKQVDLALALGFLLSGEVKRQDAGRLVQVAAVNPWGRDVTWEWLRANFPALRRLYHATGILGRIMSGSLPYLGLGRVEEVERWATSLNVPEASVGIRVGLELLKVYQRLL
ncbi:leucyl aminopeptidase [Sulfodiicoccus acidiphilus]|uniref:Aminopeptidase n=1 Tax=Sulfodiicoccus acidiphilus TaxID=1670455 RepID=A0A348B4W5_9CREN|nr:M1 family metallopeptidase [Sulfodiicoccus acidiphilus]BBD73217.1 leucyl aminopeptidase [Sulfodiicoccus acidiphilus]GGU04855.1 leucyl aminopeptidase [Sulfodiicoccus acidiphilus]